MALTKIAPNIIAVANNVTSKTVGNTSSLVSLTFDGSGVITAASNVALSGAGITANTIANSAFQTGSVENYMNAAGLGFGMRNRIINGAMVIDQRNAGASVTPTADNTYTIDRWITALSQSSKFSVQQNAGSVTPPSGFNNYVGVTSLSAYSVGVNDYFAIQQRIEGFNTLDLGWGASGASNVSLSFWVRSSLTGTFGGCLANSAFNRSYPFSYTISSANTWEQKTITIAGDTSGTWLKTNGIGIRVNFALGYGATYGNGTAGAWVSSDLESVTGATSVVGTNGATFYITGVQLEKGSTATSFDYRPYGTELQLCQRYYENSYPTGVAVGSGGYYANGFGIAIGAGDLWGSTSFKVLKRATPTIAIYGSQTGTANKARQSVTGTEVTSSGVSQITAVAFTDVTSASLFNTSIPYNVYDYMWTATAEI